MGSAPATSRARLQSRGAKTKQPLTPRAQEVATVTVADLRTNFKAIEAKLAKGVRIQVTRRGEVIAEMFPAPAPPAVAAGIRAEQKQNWADFLAERQAALRDIWGDTPVTFDTTALISEGRERDLLP
jgi:antitoxin (DNA-binding transcriptional repressor) of toxin-antitoxin stability system